MWIIIVSKLFFCFFVRAKTLTIFFDYYHTGQLFDNM